MRTVVLESGKVVALDENDNPVMVFDEQGIPDNVQLTKAEAREVYGLVHESRMEDAVFESEELLRHPRIDEAREEILSKGFSNESLKRIDGDPRVFSRIARETLESLPPSEKQEEEQEAFKVERKALRKALREGKVESIHDIASVIHSEMKHRGIDGLEGHDSQQDIIVPADEEEDDDE